MTKKPDLIVIYYNNSLFTYFNVLCFSEPCPLYIVPSNFTRTEKPINYAYTDKRYFSLSDGKDADDNVHNTRRTARTKQYSKYEFSLTNEMPTEPHDSMVKHLQGKIAMQPLLQEEYDIVKKVYIAVYLITKTLT